MILSLLALARLSQTDSLSFEIRVITGNPLISINHSQDLKNKMCKPYKKQYLLVNIL